MKYTGFHDMPVWQDSLDLSYEVFELTKVLPRSEDYGLCSQIRRSANSVTSNIAEGFGRKKNNDKAYFNIIARGSAFETQSHLLYGEKVGYFDKVKVEVLFEKYGALIHDVNKLISFLKGK